MENKENKENKLKIFDRDILKYIAAVFMTASHFFAWCGIAKDPVTGAQPQWVQLIENIGVSVVYIFFIMVADGCYYTRSKKKYAERLLIFAVVTEVFSKLFFNEDDDFFTCNVLFTFFFAVLSIMAWDSKLSLPKRLGLVALCNVVVCVVHSEWMIIGTLLIFLLYLFREQPKKRFIAYAVVSLAHTFLVNTFLFDLMFIIRFAAAILVYFMCTSFCNGKKGRFPTFSKWFFYIFYPAHVIVLGILNKIFIK